MRPLERVGFDRIHVFARQVEAAFVKHNAFNLSGEFNLTRHALKPVFETFSLRQLQPGTVVICDNLATHYNEKAGKGKKPRQFDSFSYGVRSWGRKCRVVAHIEVGPNGRDTRFIVTSLTDHRGKYLYEKLYCARGQLCPWSDRKPHQGLETPSRLRPHIMLEGQPQPDAAHDPSLRLLADVDPGLDTFRLHLIKIAATLVEKKTRIVMSLLASCPHQSLFRLLFEALAPPHRA